MSIYLRDRVGICHKVEHTDVCHKVNIYIGDYLHSGVDLWGFKNEIYLLVNINMKDDQCS